MDKFENLLVSIMIAGSIVLLIGLYFQAIGAGIPYQDPTIEMTIEWNANYMAGSLCLRVGAITLVFGALGNIIVRIFKRTK